MTRTTIGFLALGTLLLSLAVAGAGCGPKPPCPGANVTQVQSAQDDCSAAKDELAAARATRGGLEETLTATKAEIASLEGKPAELAAQLEELRKGSGR